MPFIAFIREARSKVEASQISTENPAESQINGRSRKINQYNLLDMPDIVGITISVLFSDIQSVVRHIDNLLHTMVSRVPKRAKRKKPRAIKGISRQVRAETIYGEIHEDEAEGYYACHFYVRLAEGEQSLKYK